MRSPHPGAASGRRELNFRLLREPARTGAFAPQGLERRKAERWQRRAGSNRGGGLRPTPCDAGWSRGAYHEGLPHKLGLVPSSTVCEAHRAWEAESVGRVHSVVEVRRGSAGPHSAALMSPGAYHAGLPHKLGLVPSSTVCEAHRAWEAESVGWPRSLISTRSTRRNQRMSKSSERMWTPG